MGLVMTLSINDTQHRHSANSIECHYAECLYADCHDYLNVMLSVVRLNVVMLSVVMLNVIMLSVIMLNVVMLIVVRLNVVLLCVVAPFITP
jgi:hypothetical protein